MPTDATPTPADKSATLVALGAKLRRVITPSDFEALERRSPSAAQMIRDLDPDQLTAEQVTRAVAEVLDTIPPLKLLPLRNELSDDAGEVIHDLIGALA